MQNDFSKIMKLEHYEIEIDVDSLAFGFISTGPKGNIRKLVQFSLIDEAGFYNLSFGDFNFDTGEIDDKAITDNGDSVKVLATVVSAVYSFCDLLPNAWIYATGSTAARTRFVFCISAPATLACYTEWIP